jgi:hypothetical protein
MILRAIIERNKFKIIGQIRRRIAT